MSASGTAARLPRGHRGPLPAHAALPRHRDGAGLPRAHHRASATPWPGPTTTAPSTTSRTTPSPSSPRGSRSTCSEPTLRPIPSSTRRRTRASTSRLAKSGDHRYVLVKLESTVSNECWTIDADRARPWAACSRPAPARLPLRRRPPRRALGDPDGLGGAQLPPDGGGRRRDRATAARWKEILPHDREVFIEQIVALFRGHLAINERSEGLLRIRVMPWAEPGEGHSSSAPTSRPTPRASPINAEQDTQPPPLHLHLADHPRASTRSTCGHGERRLLKRQPVLGGYAPENYATERVWAPARDGALVPVSLVYRKGFAATAALPSTNTATAPTARPSTPEFDLATVSLLDRGFVCAHRPRPRGPGDGPRLVRGRQAAARRRTRSRTSSTPPTTWSARGTRRRTRCSPRG